MADFLVRDQNLARVTLEAKTAKGVARVHLPIEGKGFLRRVSIPDKHVDKIHPAHGAALIAVKVSAPALSPVEAKTVPAAPAAIRESGKRVEKIEA